MVLVVLVELNTRYKVLHLNAENDAVNPVELNKVLAPRVYPRSDGMEGVEIVAIPSALIVMGDDISLSIVVFPKRACPK